ncbi:CU044_5270 family protein [Planotetraspora kaengkrachanensis]|uniref:CU044_5270 family protein n=1 Tax=Planotetraspora kaengkrachanensis TaxID=575193 RepID=A0A8J3LYQ4_9ACTN|nr:CU044_5270 family protein [Planotetraspora kaengkrachanensis]GIG79190.1 hypothetical protein Pka01_23170 [Planotetraspora kaengkrachanensis]
MTDEFDMIAEARPEAPAYSPAAKASARRRLTALAAEAPSRRRPFGIMITGVAVVAGASVVVVNGVQPAGAPAPAPKPAPGVVALPKVENMSASEVLSRAAKAATDLNPRNDQFIKVTSETMYSAIGIPTGSSGKEPRYLYRDRRTIWLSVDGSRDGTLTTEHLQPRPYPGWPVPKQAYSAAGTTESMKLPTCGHVPDTVYTRLKRLPTSEKEMRAHLFAGPRTKNPPEVDAWTMVGDLLRETYMPAPQRAALFKAAATIPRVEVTGGVTDAAGRRGIGVGVVRFGIREDLVFDAKTFQLLGERGTVVDAKAAQAPAGSVLSSTAQLQVSIVDAAPDAPDPISEKQKICA